MLVQEAQEEVGQSCSILCRFGLARRLPSSVKPPGIPSSSLPGKEFQDNHLVITKLKHSSRQHQGHLQSLLLS